MRKVALLASLLGLGALIGCEAETKPVSTEKLTLTAEQAEAIKSEDLKVKDEEGAKKQVPKTSNTK